MRQKKEIVKLKFKVPKGFNDPLKTSEDSFDEIECEEWKHYYGIHLGVPVNNEEELEHIRQEKINGR